MKTKILFAAVFVLALGTGVLILMSTENQPKRTAPQTPELSVEHTGASQPVSQSRVPAYQQASEVGKLSPTLPPSQFFGKAREAYQVAKEIPQTLAQLPCYCHCDASIGHKSLHTCFVDDHASHCAVCVDEALLAYSLQRDEKLSPEQVRERIIEKYSSGHQH